MLSTRVSKDISYLNIGWILTILGRNIPYMALINNIFFAYLGHKAKIYFEMIYLEIFLSETTKPIAFIFGM